MANGQSQGLHAFLIVFVVLTLLFIVTTFFGFNSYNHASQAMLDYKKKYEEQQKVEAIYRSDIEQLKVAIGHAYPAVGTDSDEPGAATVMGGFKKDMADHAGEADKDYKSVVAHLAGRNTRLEADRAQLQETNNRLEDALKRLQSQTRLAIAEADKWRDQAKNDLAGFQLSFTENLTSLTKQLDETRAQVQTLTLERDQLAHDREADRRQYEQEIAQINALRETLEAELKGYKDIDLAVPDGVVRTVSYDTHSVYINLGRADGLLKQLTFSIYPRDAQQVATSKPKAKIEVVRIIDDHLAEARITSAEVLDPIEPGDLIYSPGWQPGRKMRFALVGVYELDEQPGSDRNILKGLLEQAGGVIDAEVVEGTGELVGDITHETNFVLLGKMPEIGEAEAKEAGEKAAGIGRENEEIRNLLKKAQTYGVRIVAYEDYLDYMGYKPRRRLFQAGADRPYTLKSGARSASAQKPAVYGRTSVGRVAGLYMPGQRAELMPRSPGRVSGLYRAERPTVQTSTGTTSKAVQQTGATATAPYEAHQPSESAPKPSQPAKQGTN